MKQFTGFVRSHTLIVIYSLVILLLLGGVIASSGFTHLFKMGIFIFALIGSYIVFQRKAFTQKIDQLFNKGLFNLNEQLAFKLTFLLFLFSLASIIVHLYFLGGSPSIQAMTLTEAKDVVALRNSIIKGPSILNYIASFNIRAFLPFLLVFFLIKKKHTLFVILLIASSFYAFSLMQKSYIISLLFPVLVYTLLSRKILWSVLFIAIMGGTVYQLTKIANPQMYHQPTDTANHANELEENIVTPPPTGKQSSSKAFRIMQGLAHRIFYIPGEMVAGWFDLIPEEKPFLYGDGYRLISKLKGSEYHSYSKELYPYLRPQYAARNLKGSVNTASFMVDYANFGKFGLFFSGLILSLLFTIIERIFRNDFKVKMSLNAYPVLIISSAALSTTLFSGGWFFILAMYALFLKSDKA